MSPDPDRSSPSASFSSPAAAEGRADRTATLSIGDVADQTGVAVATLRMWEQRHGFPKAVRLPSGHRRYRIEDIEQVLQVLRRRDQGLRLDTAIAETVRGAQQAPPSVYARLQRHNPTLSTHRLRKNTLIAMSWAIEDEFCAQAHAPELFGAFQQRRFYEHSRERWEELAGAASSATVFADFDANDPQGAPARVALAPGAPLRREWTIVCDADAFPVVLTAWELPGQRGVPDHAREFEAAWSVAPADVAEASRVCRAIARGADAGPSVSYAGADGLDVLVDAQESRSLPAAADQTAVTALFSRIVAYVDRVSRR